MQYQLAKKNWKQVQQSNIELAILPWGATEAHNYHLPYGTDSLIAEFLAVKAVESIGDKNKKIVILPTISYGVNTAQIDVTLNINVNHTTQYLLLKDIVESLERQGINKLVIVNSHGANSFVPIIRELLIKYKVFICTMNTYQCVDAKLFFNEPGDHAGEMETSFIMHMYPELVESLDQAGEGSYRKFKIQSLNEGWCWAQREWLKITKDHGIGSPKAASEEKGKKCIDAIIIKMSKLFNDIAEADLNDLYE